MISEEYMKLFDECQTCKGASSYNRVLCNQCEGTGWIGGNFAVYILELEIEKVLGDNYVKGYEK